MYFGGRESGRLENAWRRKRPLSVSSFLSSVVAQNSSRILPLPEEGAQSFAGAQKAERGKCLALRLRQNTTSNLERQRQRPGGPTEGKRGVYGDVGGPSGHGEGGRFCRTDEEGEEPESGQKKNRHGIAPLWSSSKKSSLCCPLYANVGREVRLGPNYHSRSGKLYGASYVPPPPSANSITTGINFSAMCAWYSMVKHENIGTSCNFNISPKAFCAPTSFPRFPLSPPHGRSNRRRQEAREESIGRRRRGKESRSIKNWQLRERTATTAV